MLLSFIICAYNAESTLAKCVESVATCKETKGIDYEIIIIDDGSNDSTFELAIVLANRFPSIKVFHQSNVGSAASRNKGIQNATGKYLFFIDSDDFVDSREIFNDLYENSSYEFDAIRGGYRSISKEKDFLRNMNENLNDNLSYKAKSQIFWEMGFWRFIYNREFIINNNINFKPTFQEMNFPFVLDDFFFLLSFLSCNPHIRHSTKLYYFYNDGRDQIEYFNKQTALQWKAVKIYLRQLKDLNYLDPEFLFRILKYRTVSSYKRSPKSIKNSVLYLHTLFLVYLQFVIKKVKLTYET